MWDLLASAYTADGQLEKAGDAWAKTKKYGRIISAEMYANYLEEIGKTDQALEFLREFVRTPKAEQNRYLADTSLEAFITRLFREQRYVEAVEAFRSPIHELTDRKKTGLRLWCGVAAIAAAQGYGIDAKDFTDGERKALRREGLQWLHLALQDQLAGKAFAKDVLLSIERAMKDSLEPLIDAQFDDDEQLEWDAFWADVEIAQQRKQHRLPSRESGWEVVNPTQVSSANGARLTLEDDSSIIVSGPRAVADTYTIETELNAKEIRQVALVLLTDDRLPNNGPGRHDSGNFHLSELRVLCGHKPAKLKLADFSYEWPGREAAHAVDGDPNSDWHVWGETGVPHFLAVEIDSESDGNLTVQLLHGNEELAATIGRFRLLTRR